MKRAYDNFQPNLSEITYNDTDTVMKLVLYGTSENYIGVNPATAAKASQCSKAMYHSSLSSEAKAYLKNCIVTEFDFLKKINFINEKDLEPKEIYIAYFKKIKNIVAECGGFIKNDNYISAFNLLDPLTDYLKKPFANPEAQYVFGCCYKTGQGGIFHNVEAKKYFQLSANQKFHPAEFEVAKSYEDSGNKQKSFEFYKLSADGGFPEAQYKMFICYLNGIGTFKDINKAFAYCKLAADQGHNLAQFELALMYKDGKGVKAQPKCAFNYFKKCVDEKKYSWKALIELADCYFYGVGTVKNLDEAFKYFKLAENSFNLDIKTTNSDKANLYYYLGLVYEKGLGTEINLEKAFNYYKNAGCHGNAQTLYQTARNYENGQHAPQSHEKAFKYYKLAAFKS